MDFLKKQISEMEGLILYSIKQEFSEWFITVSPHGEIHAANYTKNIYVYSGESCLWIEANGESISASKLFTKEIKTVLNIHKQIEKQEEVKVDISELKLSYALYKTIDGFWKGLQRKISNS